MRRSRACIVLVGLILSARLLAQGPADLAATLERVGQRVEQYYSQVRSIVCLETVQLQPVNRDLTPDGFARRLVYELRVEWEPAPDGVPEAHELRRLLTVNGRAPRPKDEPQCTDPQTDSPEPLVMFLPARQGRYIFSDAGAGRTGGRQARMVDYRLAEPPPAHIREVKTDCWEFEAPAKTRGRAWVDAETGDVLRIDERMSGQYEFRLPRERQRIGLAVSFNVERDDSSVVYRPVTFSDPDELVLLPASLTQLQIISNVSQRLRITRTFTDYRRFTTGARIVR